MSSTTSESPVVDCDGDGSGGSDTNDDLQEVSVPPDVVKAFEDMPEPVLSAVLDGLPRRKGKWLQSEEEYAKLLVRQFQLRVLDSPSGASLRMLLANELHCDPMRITKKCTGRPLGKKLYRPDASADAATLSAAAAKRLQHKRDFIMEAYSQYLMERSMHSSAAPATALVSQWVTGTTPPMGMPSLPTVTYPMATPPTALTIPAGPATTSISGGGTTPTSSNSQAASSTGLTATMDAMYPRQAVASAMNAATQQAINPQLLAWLAMQQQARSGIATATNTSMYGSMAAMHVVNPMMLGMSMMGMDGMQALAEAARLASMSAAPRPPGAALHDPRPQQMMPFMQQDHSGMPWINNMAYSTATFGLPVMPPTFSGYGQAEVPFGPKGGYVPPGMTSMMGLPGISVKRAGASLDAEPAAKFQRGLSAFSAAAPADGQQAAAASAPMGTTPITTSTGSAFQALAAAAAAVASVSQSTPAAGVRTTPVKQVHTVQGDGSASA